MCDVSGVVTDVEVAVVVVVESDDVAHMDVVADVVECDFIAVVVASGATEAVGQSGLWLGED